jgi:hypothetical protein
MPGTAGILPNDPDYDFSKEIVALWVSFATDGCV